MGYLNFVSCEVKKGHPITKQVSNIDDSLFSDLTKEEQRKVKKWIKENILPRKTPLRGFITSYGLKHILERDIEIYMTNNQFKDAMLRCKFAPVEVNTLNWEFCISKRSPCFKIKK